jgi:hypothetical protein
MSAVFKLDNCLLWCNPDSYCTISRYFVLVVLHYSSTSNGPSFVKIERIHDVIKPILRSASMESSPIKTESVKLEIIVQKRRKCLFLFAL